MHQFTFRKVARAGIYWDIVPCQNTIDLTYQGSEHKENAAYHPGLYSRQALSFGNVGGDCIKDVNQNKKDCNQKCHPGKYKEGL